MKIKRKKRLRSIFNGIPLSDYILKRLKEPQFKKPLSSACISQEALREAVLEKSAGNYLYAVHLLEGIAQDIYQIAYLDSAPPDLEGFYKDASNRIFACNESIWPEWKLAREWAASNGFSDSTEIDREIDCDQNINNFIESPRRSTTTACSNNFLLDLDPYYLEEYMCNIITCADFLREKGNYIYANFFYFIALEIWDQRTQWLGIGPYFYYSLFSGVLEIVKLEKEITVESSVISCLRVLFYYNSINNIFSYHDFLLLKMKTKEYSEHLHTILQICEVYGKKKAFKEGISICKKVWKTSETVLGKNNFYTILSIHLLGDLHFDKGDFKKSIKNYLNAFLRGKKVFGPNNEATLLSASNLACAYAKNSEFDEAEKLFKQVIKLAFKKLGPKDHFSIAVVDQFGFYLLENGQYRKARTLLRKWSKLSRAAADGVRYNLACSESGCGYLKEAKRLIGLHIKRHPKELQKAIEDIDLAELKPYLEKLKSKAEEKKGLRN